MYQAQVQSVRHLVTPYNTLHRS